MTEMYAKPSSDCQRVHELCIKVHNSFHWLKETSPQVITPTKFRTTWTMKEVLAGLGSFRFSSTLRWIRRPADQASAACPRPWVEERSSSWTWSDWTWSKTPSRRWWHSSRKFRWTRYPANQRIPFPDRRWPLAWKRDRTYCLRAACSRSHSHS